VAILGITRGDADPDLADAVFLDIGLLGTLEADADIARQHVGIVIGAARIDREAVGQLITGRFFGVAHNRASISLVRLSGRTVGAYRPTTRPCRSIRNFVKFHLIDGPSRPNFSRVRWR